MSVMFSRPVRLPVPRHPVQSFPPQCSADRHNRHATCGARQRYPPGEIFRLYQEQRRVCRVYRYAAYGQYARVLPAFIPAFSHKRQAEKR